MPVAKLMPPSTIINIRKPVRLSERCGVSTAEKIVGSGIGSLSAVMAAHYTGTMARKTPARWHARSPELAANARKAACVWRAAARRSSKVRASA